MFVQPNHDLIKKFLSQRIRICVFKAIVISLCSTLNNCLYKSNCTTKRSNRVNQQKLDFPRDYISLMSDFSSVDSHNFNA